MSGEKREPEDAAEESSDEEGPMPAPKKMKKVLEHEQLYVDNLPDAEMYEQSLMHRDMVTHIAVSSKVRNQPHGCQLPA